MLKNKWVRWMLAIIVLFIVSIIFFPYLKAIFFFLIRLLTPFIIASFISYLLYPIVIKLEVYNIKKVLAIILIYVAFFGGAGLLLYKGIPTFIKELQELTNYLPQLIQIYEQMVYSIYASTSLLPEAVHEQLDIVFTELEWLVAEKLEQLVFRLTNLFDYIIIFVMIPVLVFYFLKDYEQIKRYTYGLIPMKKREMFDRILHAIDDGFGSYIRGQLIISTIVFLITFLLFEIFQLKYAFVLSLFIGLMNVIPYFGPIIGVIPAIVIALASSWKLVLFVIITTIIIQIIESAFLSPYIMGKSVRLHPIIIIFTLLVSAEIGGIFAMIIAIPFVTVLRSIFRQFYPKNSNALTFK